MGLQLTSRSSQDPGYFRIGSVVLSIPPESISINRDASNQEITTLRSSTPYYKKTGRQRLDVVVSWKAIILNNGEAKDYSQWKKIRTILAYSKCAPFIEVENQHLRQFVINEELGYGDTDRMAFAIRSMKVETVPDLADSLQVTLYLSWFNYLPYTLNFAYGGPDNSEVSAQDSPYFDAYINHWMRPPNLPEDSQWQAQNPQEFLVSWRRYLVFQMPTDLVQTGAVYKGLDMETPFVPSRLSSYGASKHTPVEPPPAIKAAIVNAAKKYGIDPNLALSISQRESTFNPNAKNPKSTATGLFQLLSGTAAQYGLTGADVTDPVKNADAGCHYLQDLSKMPWIHGDLTRMLVGFSAGQGNVQQLGVDGSINKFPWIRGWLNDISAIYDKRCGGAVPVTVPDAPAPAPASKTAEPVPATGSPNNDKRDLYQNAVIQAFADNGWVLDYTIESDLFFYQEETINLFAGSTVPAQITALFQNNLAQLPLENQIFPAMQHIGSPGSLVTVTFNSVGERAHEDAEPVHQSVAAMNGMMAKLDSQFHEMRGRWRAASKIHRMQCVRVQNQFLNMLGIDFSLPQQLHSETVPDSSDLLVAQLTMSQYKNRYEALKGFLVKDPSWKKMKAVSDIVTGDSWNSIDTHVRGSRDFSPLADFRARSATARKKPGSNPNLSVAQAAKTGNLLGPDITLFTDAVANGWRPPETKLNFTPSDPANSHIQEVAVEIASLLEGQNQWTNAATWKTGTYSNDVSALILRLRSGAWTYTDYITLMAMRTSGPQVPFLTQGLKDQLAQRVDPKIQEVEMADGRGVGGLYAEGAAYSNPFYRLRDELLRYKFENDPSWTVAVQQLMTDRNLRERLWESDEMYTPSDDPSNRAHLCYTDLGITNLNVDPDMYFKDYSAEMRQKILEGVGAGAKLLSDNTRNLNTVHGFKNSAAGVGNASEVSTAEAEGLLSDYSSIMTEKINPPQISMCRAFPTYKLMLIEEDNDGPFYCFDNFYTYNSVINIEVARYKDKPDIARIQLTNFTNILDHKFYNGTTLSKIEEEDRDHEEVKSLRAVDAQTGQPMAAVNPDAGRQTSFGAKNRLTGVDIGSDEYMPRQYYALQTGSKVQVRLGYSNDPDKLWPVFHGVVTEIEEGEIMTIVCQGYMVELIDEVSPEEFDLEHGSSFKFYKTITGEVDKVMEKMIQGPFAKHFGSRKVFRGQTDILGTLGYHPLNSAIRDSAKTVAKVFSPGVAAILTYLTTRKSRATENVWINRFLVTKGEQTAADQIGKRMATRPLYVTAPTSFPFSVGSFHVPESVSHLSPWKVMKCASRFWPEYNLLVKNYGFPFQADATLVFGDPSDYFYSRARTGDEGGGVGSYHPRMDPSFQAWWKAKGKSTMEGILRVLNTGQTRQFLMDTYLNMIWAATTRGTSPGVSSTMLYQPSEDTMVQETLATVHDVKSFETLMKNFWRAYQAAKGETDPQNSALLNAISLTSGAIRSGADWFLNTRDKWDVIVQAILALDKSFRSFMQLYNDPQGRKWAAGRSIMPVQKWHVITTEHIISNTIALNEHVYNTVRIDTGGVGNSPEVMKANASIPSEELRLLDVTDQIIAPKENLNSNNLWRLQAQSFLREELGKMYRGELVILGQPEIEPGDVVHLVDTTRDLFGPVEVDSVIHSFDERDGMITIIRPRALVLVNQTTGAGITYAVSQFFFGSSPTFLPLAGLPIIPSSDAGFIGAVEGLVAGYDSLSGGSKTGAKVLGGSVAVTAGFSAASALRFGKMGAGAASSGLFRVGGWAAGKAAATTGARAAVALGASSAAAYAGAYLVPGVNILMAAWTVSEAVHGAISIALEHTAMHPVFIVPLTRYNKPWMSGVARWSMANMGYTISQKWQRMYNQEWASSLEGVEAMAGDAITSFKSRAATFGATP